MNGTTEALLNAGRDAAVQSAAETGAQSLLQRGASMATGTTARSAVSIAARIGLRAIPVVGLGLLAYDLGDLAARAATGKGIADHASSLLPRLAGQGEAVARVEPVTEQSERRAAFLKDVMAMTGTAAPPSPARQQTSGMEIG